MRIDNFVGELLFTSDQKKPNENEHNCLLRRWRNVSCYRSGR